MRTPSDPIPAPRELTGCCRPWRLLELTDPPGRLFLHGRLPRGPAVAIVGTRHPTAEAVGYARELAGELASNGVTILSGGAKGIDAAAHLGALDAGGPTVVIAPAGLARPYPEEHAELFLRVVREGGGYLSACSPDTPAELAAFFGRNAVLVALADAVVVVESPVRSGARNAAQHARRLNRPLFAVPAPPWNPRGLGCIVELKLGARALYSYRDVLGVLMAQRLHPVARPDAGPHPLHAARPGEGSPSPASQPAPSRPIGRASAAGHAGRQLALLPEQADLQGISSLEVARVRTAVDRGAASIDEVCDGSGLELRRVQHVLAVLIAGGILAMGVDGRLALRG